MRLQTTTVVNETYITLFGQREIDWKNRGQYFAIAAQLMRRILVDHVRNEGREKRGGRVVRVELEAAVGQAHAEPVDVGRRPCP
jgi:hypothetical protein